MVKRIFVNCAIPQAEINKLKKFFSVKINNPDKNPLSEDEFSKKASGYEAIILQGNEVKKPFIEQNKETLKLISNIGVGFDNIDIKTASKYKIPVFNTPNVLDDAVADLTIGLLIAASRKIYEGHSYIVSNKWKKNSWPLFWGEDLRNESLGIIGLGNIGKEVAKRAASFGLNIYYHNRTKLSEKIEKDINVNFLKFDMLLKKCKYVILTLPLNKSSFHLFNKKTFKKMRNDAFLINVARGKIINENDLVEAIKNKNIKGAGLDVFEFEPKVNKKLYKLKNVVLLPHMGSATIKTRNDMMRLACDNLINYFNKNKKDYMVNRKNIVQ